MSVHKKLMEARVKLHSAGLKKSGRNDFAKYSYFELGDFMPQALSIFAELNICGYVSFTEEVASLKLIDTEDNSELIITSPMRQAEMRGMHPIQCMGAVQTYMRRYLWVAALEIVEKDVIDSLKPSGSSEENKEKKKPLTPEDKQAWARAKESFIKNGNLEKVLAHVSISKEHQSQLMKECEVA